MEHMTEAERVGALVLGLKVTRSQAVILDTLRRANGRVVSQDGLRSALYALESKEPESNVISVQVYQLRRRFGHGEIVTAGRVCGYALTPKGIARVDAGLRATG